MRFHICIFRPVTSRPAGKYEAAYQEAFERKLSERSVRLNAACQKYGDLLHWQAGGDIPKSAKKHGVLCCSC